jgi:hypothetical protein
MKGVIILPAANRRTPNQNRPAANTARRPHKRRKSKPLSIGTLLTLIVCFPAGLFFMWKKSTLPHFVKATATLIVTALIIAVLLPATNPPEREMGGIYLVDQEPSVEIQGPEAPADRQVIEIYAPRYSPLILEPTPSPVPVVVYCNNGGAHYHVKECKYVNEKTPNVSLQRAVEAGYTQCTECAAPSPY